MDLNLTEMEYIVEVAKHGSISKAARSLFVSQPHISTQIRNVEERLGVSLFKRSAKGITMTKEGLIFVEKAQQILSEVDALKSTLHIEPEKSVRSNISVTRSYQVNRCIAQFINEHSDNPSFVMNIKETNPFQVVEDVYTRQAELGILHFFDAQKEYFFNCFQRYSLIYHNHYERDFLLVMSKDSPLSAESVITKDMLRDRIIVFYGDYEIPAASYEDIAKVNDIILSDRRIYVYDRASAMETLKNCPDTYMWTSGLHDDTLRQYGLILRRCEDVAFKNLGGSIYSSEEPLSWSTNELFKKMLNIDWTEAIS